ncbi:MAG: membrane protein insertase YidC [Moraxella sp.]|nr:membrane protein insertase YidC [Moraxella sp.]
MQKIFRGLLIVAMLITAYLLILAWQKDYGNTPAPTTTQSAPASASSDLGATSGSDLPVSVATAGAGNPNSPLISVKTDRYDIKINPVGGDIVYAALVEYDATLGSDSPFVLLEDNANRVYVAQTLLGGRDGIDTQAGRAVYQSAQTSYQMTGDSLVVPLTYQKDGVIVTKTYEFKKGSYPISVKQTINNTSAKDWQGEFYVQLKRDNSKDPGLSDKGALSMATYLGGAWGNPDSPYNKLKFGNFNDNELTMTSSDGYVAMIQHYFVSAWTPQNFSAKFFSRSTDNDNYIGYSSLVDVGAGKQITLENTLYAGPKVQSDLAGVATGLEKTVDYGFLWPIAKPLFLLLELIHKVLGNWGWSIIGLTLLVKLALMWFSSKSYHSMAKMRLIAPRLQALKEECGDDRMKMSQEMMKIYREEKVNPMAGCLPILMQMPIFLALYWVLVESVELRHAPWILWIQDLSAMDPWFILPILMGATMYVQQLLNPQPTDPMQAKIMRILPLVFTVFMLFFPAGLVLYWTVNNLFSMTQQHLINKKVEKEYQQKQKTA